MTAALTPFRYFVLQRTNNDNYPLLGSDDANLSSYLYRDKQIADNYKAKLKLGKPIPRNFIMADYHSLPQSVVSKRLMDILNSFDLEQVNFIPALVDTPKGEFDYWILNTRRNIIDCLDREQSRTTLSEDKSLILQIERLVLDQEKLAELPENRRKIFCVLAHQHFDIVDQEVANAIRKIQPTGLRLIPVEEWRDDIDFEETQDNNITPGARLMSLKLRYEMQDDDVNETYLFTNAIDSSALRVSFESEGGNADVVFGSKAFESAKKHITISGGHATTFNGDQLSDEVLNELPPFLLSRKVFEELRSKGKAKFQFPWSYEKDATELTLQERKSVTWQIDGTGVDIPLLICIGNNEDCEDITVWIVDDGEWPLILINDWNGDFYWRFVKGGANLELEDLIEDDARFDKKIFQSLPLKLEAEVKWIYPDDNYKRIISRSNLPEGSAELLSSSISVSTASHGKFKIGPFVYCYHITVKIPGSKNGLGGYFYCKAISLTTASDTYDPAGILIWVPDLKTFGSYDSDHCSLHLFPGKDINDILKNAEYFITQGWSMIEPEVEVSFLREHFDFVPDRFEKEIMEAFERDASNKAELLKQWLLHWESLIRKYSFIMERLSYQFHKYLRLVENSIDASANDDVDKKADSFSKYGQQLENIKEYFQLLLPPNHAAWKDIEKVEKVLQDRSFEMKFNETLTSNSSEHIIQVLPSIDKITDKQIESRLLCSIYNKFNDWLKAKRFDEAKKLLEASISLLPKMNILVKSGEPPISRNLKESLLSDAIVLSILAKDDSIFKTAEESIPNMISDGTLAFNLACLYAVKRQKNNMLQFILISLGLGKDKGQFLNDSDFDFYKGDADFIGLF
jgi:hypothetical protein